MITHSPQQRVDVTGKTIVYIDMDDTLCDFTSLYQHDLIYDPERYPPQSRVGFFLDMLPIRDSIETVEWLNQQPQLAVFILTAPSIKNASCYTEKRLWVEKYLGMEMVGRLIISGYKNLSRGDVLIDDSVEGRGQEEFQGVLLHFGSEEYPDWRHIRRYFEQLLNTTERSI